MQKILLLLASVLCVSSVVGDEPGPVIPNSVNDMMVSVITPATNTLWGIENPQTDADWQVFIDAADAVIETAGSLKHGGAGPNDQAWSESPDWQAFVDTLIEAGNAARQAALNKNVDAMFAAGDALYSPCEECHIQFHPGMQ
jgi:cytochrome c556